MTEREEEDDGVELKVEDDGSLLWYRYGVLHRDDGPAVVRPARGGYERWWYRFGKLHRDDGPAIMRPDGLEEWFCGGKLHREDGPAIERADSSKEYWLDGEFLDGGAAELARRRPPALLRVIKKKWPLKPE